MQTKTKNQKGFVVLFAVLISAVVLAITLGISNTAYKEILLTSQAREATYSFFAADSGSECALYADLQKNAFSSSGSSFDCGGTTVSPTVSGTRYDFQLQFTNSETNLLSCAVVNVDKDAQVTLPDGTIGSYTVIKSFGYNTDCSSAGSSSLRVVERAIKVQYPNDVVSGGTEPTPPSL